MSWYHPFFIKLNKFKLDLNLVRIASNKVSSMITESFRQALGCYSFLLLLAGEYLYALLS